MKPWGSLAEEPVWWQVEGPWGEQLVAHRKDTYRSARNSVRLVNPSADPAVYTELTQSVRVVGGADYRLTAWAATAFDPHTVELKLTFLNAAGESVAETVTTGVDAGLNRSAFKMMLARSTSPTDAVRALVAIRLAGGGTTDASGTITPR